MKKDTIQLIIILVVLAAVVVGILVYMPHDIVTIYNWYKEHLTYGTILLLMAIESSFIPFPSEVVIPPAAYFAARNGDMNIIMIVVIATLGALIGAVINYVLSLLIGRPVVYAFANSRIGHMCLIDAEKVEKAEAYFDRHGAISTFLGRLIPAIRQLISIPAGIARMPLGEFTLFTALGAGVWTAILAAVGYAIGRSTADIGYLELCTRGKEMATAHLPLVVAAAVVLALAYLAVSKLVMRRSSKS